jgi:hypothetical protein
MAIELQKTVIMYSIGKSAYQRIFRIFLFTLCSVFWHCESPRSLQKKIGPLKYDVIGKYFVIDRFNPHLNRLDSFELELRKEKGVLRGYFSRKIRQIRGEYSSMTHFEAELFNPIHSEDEIIFREELILSCYYPYTGPFDKKIGDWKDSDFGKPECWDKERVAARNQEHRTAPSGDIYLKVVSNDEILWAHDILAYQVKFRKIDSH